MKKFILIVFIFTLTLLVAPSQTYAAWWNPLSWFSKNQRIEEQKQPQNATSSNTASEPQNIVVPANNPQPSDAKTIEDLRAEVVTLKASLDNLYTAHNNLVNDHNALLKYVNTTISSGKDIGATTNNSNLETKLTNLETKLNDVCAQIFSSFSVLGTKCPSSRFIIQGTLESRIKKLEGGY
ncbi:MAG: hypothetical protein HYT98_05180 [Candidatus Sungbacteria bacterium]|nr:hypothetical protein [Candidatus Sungbacteria bacterium]